MTEPKEYKKYVVVLAHADGWGALSANKVVKRIHEQYPDVGIYLIVSQATKNKEGGIATKLEDLRLARELKETNLLEYFQRIDARYEHTPLAESEGNSASLLTFKQLAQRYCADQAVHYTTKGGPTGGAEVATVVANLEKQHGHGPEVLLSVDTMAILPKDLLERYNCFSTHPGPLDTIKIEGMQGTLRSLVNQVLYNAEGKPLPADHIFGMGAAHIKGTLFMQHPELDKGPPIALTQSFVCPGMCAYQSRDEVYHALTDEMLKRLPVFLDKDARAALVQKATQEKEALDALPHHRIPELEPGQFATWQGNAIGFADDSQPHGVDVVQNEIINPQYFKNQMRRFFPGSEVDFDKEFVEVYGTALDRLAKQKDQRLTDPWARYYAGDTGVTIRQYDPNTGAVIAEHRNAGRT